MLPWWNKTNKFLTHLPRPEGWWHRSSPSQATDIVQNQWPMHYRFYTWLFWPSWQTVRWTYMEPYKFSPMSKQPLRSEARNILRPCKLGVPDPVQMWTLHKFRTTSSPSQIHYESYLNIRKHQQWYTECLWQFSSNAEKQPKAQSTGTTPSS
jgi:hypothetical protein